MKVLQCQSEKELREYIKDHTISSKEWERLTWMVDLSEDFIREFEDNFRRDIHWRGICWFQNLSETFIREFKDEVHWDIISRRQKISNKLKYEKHDKIHIRYIIKKNKNPKEVI